MESNVDHGFFNIGSNSTISVLDLANIMIETAKLDLKPIHGPELPGDVRITRADITSAKELLKWEPKIEFRDWLKMIISTKKFSLAID